MIKKNSFERRITLMKRIVKKKRIAIRDNQNIQLFPFYGHYADRVIHSEIRRKGPLKMNDISIFSRIIQIAMSSGD